MTHQPPVPAGNQSPYPLHEAPHAPDAGPPASAAVARTPAAKPGGVSAALVGGLVAAGVAVLAGVGAWAWATEPKYKRKERKERKRKK